VSASVRNLSQMRKGSKISSLVDMIETSDQGPETIGEEILKIGIDVIRQRGEIHRAGNVIGEMIAAIVVEIAVIVITEAKIGTNPREETTTDTETVTVEEMTTTGVRDAE
jgi:hypothetical protein